MRVAVCGELIVEPVIRNHPVDQAHVIGACGAEDLTFEQDFLGVGRADQLDQRFEFVIGHHQAQALDRNAEAALLTADPKVGGGRDLEAAADAKAVDPSR